jgi:hypothetical protein
MTSIVSIRRWRLMTAYPEDCVLGNGHANRIDVTGEHRDQAPDAGRPRNALRPSCNVEMIPSAVSGMVQTVQLSGALIRPLHLSGRSDDLQHGTSRSVKADPAVRALGIFV